MKPFKYSMESLLDYRKDKEEKEKQQFAVLQEKYLVEKKNLADLEDKLQNVLSMDVVLSSIEDHKNVYHYIQYLREKIVLQKQLTQNYELQLDNKRNTLISAQKDRKVVEKLKEKAWDKYQAESNRLEQKINDEFALYAFFRK